MKRILLTFMWGGVLLLAFTQCCGYLLLPQKTKGLLPQNVVDAINKSDTVLAYQIDAMSETNDSSEVLCDFVVKGKPVFVQKENVEQLKELIDSVAFNNSSNEIHKFSTFIPDFGFKFCSGRKIVVALLDLHADMWTFYYKKKEYKMDNDSIHAPLLSLLKSIFEKSNIKSMVNNALQDDKTQLAIPHFAGTDTTTNDISTQQSDTVQKYIKLKPEILQIISDAKSINCYIIDPLETSDKGTERLEEYLILQKSEIKDNNIIKDFQQLISGNKSFEKLDLLKNCTFLPDIAFQVRDKSNTLNIFFSFYCNECKITLNGEWAFRNDCSIIQQDIIALAKKIYPKDKYLRTISKK